MNADHTPPRHGARARYLRGCRCEGCRRAHYRYMSRYRLERERGTIRRVPVGPVAEHISRLTAEGWSCAQIAAAANCSESSVRSAARRQYATMRADLAARILAARPTLATAGPRTNVASVGTIRRVQALTALGYSLREISAASGIVRTALGHIITHEHPVITAQHARSIAALYRAWSTRQGTNTRARNRALALGWHGPLAWDDIDDPNATPWTGEDPHLNRNELAAVRRQEIEHLAGFGLGAEEIAARLGDDIAVSTVKGILADLRNGPRDRRKEVAA
ncbi:hypothetical protein [Streptomyces sp. NPDC001054]